MPALDRVFPQLGPKFDAPRPQQVEAIERLREGWRKVNFLEAPTGVGKSAIALALARLQGSPFTVITTQTISLQEQYAGDFEGICTLVGKHNFECTRFPGLSPADAPCSEGEDGECDSLYYAQERRYARAQTVVTNYALYLAELLYGRRWKVRPPSLLVCDEGHNLFDQLVSAESVELDLALAKRLGLKGTAKVKDLETAQAWARTVEAAVNRHWYHLASIGNRRAREWKKLKVQIERLADASPSLVTVEAGDRFRAAPVWPSWSTAALLDSADSILVMSATLYGGAAMAELLGCGAADYQYVALDSPFPAWRWPVFYRPVANLNHDSTPDDWQRVADACHDIMHGRVDKGVVHVASYEQVTRLYLALYACKSCRKRLVAPQQAEKRAQTIARFRKTAGAWLIHPYVGEGESFDDDQCRTQIVAKLRYPDLSDPLIRERTKTPLGKKHYFYSVAAYTVQSLGRGMRHEDDYCENFILDGAFGRLYKYHEDAFPRWFKKLLR